MWMIMNFERIGNGEPLREAFLAIFHAEAIIKT
jgi:hypothetical protein